MESIIFVISSILRRIDDKMTSKYTKRLLWNHSYISKRASLYSGMTIWIGWNEMCNIYDTCMKCMFNSNKKLCVLKINEVNWNILLTSGKEIKRDSLSNVNEIRKVLNK